MNADDPLARAISDWQRKHHIADGDPMIAALELVRIYQQLNPTLQAIVRALMRRMAQEEE